MINHTYTVEDTKYDGYTVVATRWWARIRAARRLLISRRLEIERGSAWWGSNGVEWGRRRMWWGLGFEVEEDELGFRCVL